MLRQGAALCLLAVIVPLYAQLGHNGTVSGVVTAPDGAQVANATVTLSGPDGFTRNTTTAVDGTFSLVDLPSGTYTVQATSPGFAPFTQPSVSVAVGRNTHLALTLAVANAQQTVNVTASQTAFDTSQTSSVVNIDRDRVEELPIPNRNYLTFVALSPQAAPANPALTQQTLAQGNGGFSFGGLRPGSNAVSIDGVDDDDEYSGSSRAQLSPEAISDFQIVNHGFSAESGGAAGGSIEVQTRSGLNRPHGDAFVFVQNGALNGTPPLDLSPYKPDESRLRAGVALGGAIQRDKYFTTSLPNRRSLTAKIRMNSGPPPLPKSIVLLTETEHCRASRLKAASFPLPIRRRNSPGASTAYLHRATLPCCVMPSPILATSTMPSTPMSLPTAAPVDLPSPPIPVSTEP